MAAAVAYGVMLSLKQSLLFFVVHWLLLERRGRYLGLGLAAGLATLIPFALWDLPSLWSQGLLFHFTTGYRREALTIFAPLAAAFDIAPTRWWSVGMGAVATAVSFLAFRGLKPLLGYLWAVTLTTLAMFLFGNKAFTNYYYFVGGLLVFLIAEGLRTAAERPAGVPQPAANPRSS